MLLKAMDGVEILVLRVGEVSLVPRRWYYGLGWEDLLVAVFKLLVEVGRYRGVK
jgi:hypothetical protein